MRTIEFLDRRGRKDEWRTAAEGPPILGTYDVGEGQILVQGVDGVWWLVQIARGGEYLEYIRVDVRERP